MDGGTVVNYESSHTHTPDKDQLRGSGPDEVNGKLR
jgi:hypothetical protein